MKYVYKIIAALGALASIPLMIFGANFTYSMASAGLEALFSIGELLNIGSFTEYLQQHGGQAPTHLGDTTSLYEFSKLIDSISGFEGDGSIMEELSIVLNPAIVLMVAMAAIAICAIVAAICAFVSKNNRHVIYACVAGIGFSMMIPECFEALAAPILDGSIKFSTLLGTSFADMIGSIEVLELSSSFWFIPLVFAGVIAWTVLYNATLPENEKTERKIMLGEVDL